MDRLFVPRSQTPPKVSIDAIKAISLEEALAMDDSIFGNCADYVSIFEKYGAQLDIPPILLASLAMQESSCRADVLGDNGGAFGLMQVSLWRTRTGCAQP